jgi:hypothetical protein
MKKYFCLIALFIVFTSCAQTQQHAVQNTADTTTENYSAILSRTIPDSAAADFLPSYITLKNKIQAKRNAFYQQYMKAATDADKNKVLDSAKQYLGQALVHNVFPYWYGTQWDFNGISEQPQHGKIACGYFVSTTIKQCGFNLNRYKIAQQYSHSIVNTLCSDIKTLRSIESLLAYINTQPDQLYIVGLDNHVGFISKDSSAVTFIHASFVGKGCVESETAELSPVLQSSGTYVLGTFSGNKKILLQWLTNSAVVLMP